MINHLHQQPSSPRRVVILGGSGFIGKTLAKRLRDAGTEVVALSSSDLNLTADDAPEKLARQLQPTDALVFASCLTPDKGKDIGTTMQNLAMGHHVATALEQSPVAHVIYISSDAVYADDVSLASETAKCEPASLYGMGHLMRERMMETAAASGDLPLFILRASLVYGNDDTHNSYGPNRFRRAAAEKGQIDLFGGGEETRDHIAIDDVCRLIEQALLHRSTGILNAATGVSTSFFDVATLVAEFADGDVKVNCSQRRNPVTHRKYDITNTLKAFPNFRFKTLREGVAECAKQAKQTGSLKAVA
ncbi:MAG: NAD(P)-dependent oxidoreductase [Pirellulaceae bacterium]